jgi:hypothetical protein
VSASSENLAAADSFHEFHTAVSCISENASWALNHMDSHEQTTPWCMLASSSESLETLVNDYSYIYQPDDVSSSKT